MVIAGLCYFFVLQTTTAAAVYWIFFLEAIVRYGPLSRLRTDRGGENDVCLMMNIFRGFNRGSAVPYEAEAHTIKRLSDCGVTYGED